jgi:N-acetylmuramoyl-L-alanine amidase
MSLVFLAPLGLATSGHAAAVYVLEEVSPQSTHDETQIILTVSGPVQPQVGRLSEPDRLYVDLPETRLTPGWGSRSVQVEDGRLRTVRIAQNQPDQVRVVLDLQTIRDYQVLTQATLHRIVIALQGSAAPAPARPEIVPVKASPAPPTSARLSKAKARPLVIVIDPGHGGKDPGAIGAAGLEEKTAVLQVAKALRHILRQELPHALVRLTREDDVFIPLAERARMANQLRAQLFISLHANSSPNPEASGLETWYLSFAANERAKKTAARENMMSVSQLSDLEIILRDLHETDRINQSAVLAGMVQAALAKHLEARYPGIPDRGVEGAPFVVLLHTTMPSVLVELSFIINPREEKRLDNPAYQRALAQGVFHGVRRFLQTSVVAAD